MTQPSSSPSSPARQPPVSAPGPGGRGSAEPARRGLPGSGASSLFHPPYRLSSDFSLSEDYYQFSLAGFDPSVDQIVGYSQNDAYAAEAMVVLHSQNRDGALSQLYHDWTKNNAWAIAPVTVGGGAVVGVLDAAAGVTQLPDETIGRLQVFRRTASGVTRLEQAADSSWSATDQGWPPDVGPLQLTFNQFQATVAYCFGPTAPEGKATLYWYSVFQDDDAAHTEIIQHGQVYGITRPPGARAAMRISASDTGFGVILIYAPSADGTLRAWQAEWLFTTGRRRSARPRR